MKRNILFIAVAMMTPILGCNSNQPASLARDGVGTESVTDATAATAPAATAPASDAVVKSELDAKPESDAEPAANTTANSATESSTASKEMSDKSTTIVFGDQYPEVIKVDARHLNDEKWRFNVTLSSAYDTPARYADAWRVLDQQGNQLGIRVLTHDHAAEQPFRRSGTIQIPSGTATVFVEGRDQSNGWSGQRFEYKLN